MLYAPEDPEEIEAWRSDLDASIKGWKARWRGLYIEHQSRDRLLRIAEKGELRVAKQKRRPQVGTNAGPRELDMATVRKNQLIQLLGQTENDMEELEEFIAEAEEQLGSLPAEADDSAPTPITSMERLEAMG